MKNKYSLLAAMLGVLLTGCAADSQMQTELLPPTNDLVCCSEFALFPFVQLNDDENIKSDIDITSSVATFSQGNSYFSAFRFSDRSADVEVMVSSLMINDSVFAPEILLLDEQFKPSQVVNFSDFHIRSSNAFTRTRYVKTLRINAQQTPYLVIYTPAEQLGKKIKVDHPAKVRAKEFGEVMPMVTDPVYTHVLGGRIELEVKTLTRRALPTNESVSRFDSPVTQPKTNLRAQSESQQFYLSAITQAVAAGEIAKALSLLDEAKALNIPGAQEAFVRAVNQKQ